MSSLLKDIYSEQFYDRFSETLTHVIPSFDKQEFLKDIYTSDFKLKELKERMKHTAKVLHAFLPEKYPDQVKLIEQIITRLRAEKCQEDSLVYMFFSDYIETYGLEDYATSVKALEFITQFVSCEFAVRPFILKYGHQMLSQMLAWSKHENHKVRRLSSEGSRPRLPWAMALPALKKNPEPILALLENLKNDPHEWVRRSVANSLNDIAKDHPDIVLDIAGRWKGQSKETDAIVKHGCRTLLKQGHVEILKHYGLESKNITISDFEILTPEVKIGDSLSFSFTVLNKDSLNQIIRLEYAIYYKRQNGTFSKKVFKISEKMYLPKAKVKIGRKQNFRIITTRKFYSGLQSLSIIVNGEEKAIADFQLVD